MTKNKEPEMNEIISHLCLRHLHNRKHKQQEMQEPTIAAITMKNIDIPDSEE